MSNAISAVASLLWPLIVLAALVVFRNPLARLIRQRDFTVKIAGQELSVNDLNDQQTALITDLQKQVALLEQQVSELTGGKARPGAAPSGTTENGTGEDAPPVPASITVSAPAADPETGQRDKPAAARPSGTGEPVLDIPAGPAPWDRLPGDRLPADPAAEPGESAAPNQTALATASAVEPAPGGRFGGRPKPSGVLWVADRPESNALEMARLQANNVHVDVATTTERGLEKLSGHRYELIVSDMARVERGQPVSDAGQRFVRQVRALDHETPIVIYADGLALDKYGPAALAAGATTVTSNSYELAREFATLGLV